MKQVVATVISNEKLWEEFLSQGRQKYAGTWLMRLNCPEMTSEAKPGQFVMVRCGEDDELPLRRPLSVHQTDGDKLALLFNVVGNGTYWLSKRQKGNTIDLLGPLGNGFSINPDSNNLLLVAGGNGIAPLYFLAQEALKKRCSVTLLYGTADRNRCSIPPQIKLVSATEDGTVGYRGKVTDLLPQYTGRADQVFVCGPLGMYKEMYSKREELLKDKPTQVSLEVRMGCGLGVCYGCTVKTKSGLKQVCKDGPVFNLDDIIWDELDY
ncbi:MAG: dihydroorotate dehydrogenase electron transfer subunit [Dehalococcoidales bacterium]|nr:dihydroorotate dehydrogenase electron transfer subunit [Dehalococcoidales bacterium]